MAGDLGFGVWGVSRVRSGFGVQRLRLRGFTVGGFRGLGLMGWLHGPACRFVSMGPAD